MLTFLFTFLIMALVIAGMAVGVMMGRKPIKGSCGGMSSLGIGTACEICGGNPQKCDEAESPNADKKTPAKNTALAYEAK